VAALISLPLIFIEKYVIKLTLMSLISAINESPFSGLDKQFNYFVNHKKGK
jgi:hypothetical protein